MIIIDEKFDVQSLTAGEQVLYSGYAYTARDAAHKRFVDAISAGKELPIDLSASGIYYAGPTPTLSGEVIGSCGPTTSTRMDDYTPTLLDRGLKIMIGKGKRSDAVIASIKKNKAIYLIAVGGAAALIKDRVVENTYVAYDDLGCEAVRKIKFDKLPLLVAIDSCGNSIF